jgi:two-component system sensor histidine kinase YesM
MKMSHKLILLFSLMALLTTAANTFYFLHLEMDALQSNTISNLTAVGDKMIDEIEQYVQMMDYAMDSMTSNAEFMESMHLLDQLGSDADVVSAQTMISQSLYHSPINGRFYRVSMFNKNGLYISSQFENTGMIPSLSDEAREVVANLPWLEIVEKDVYHSHLVPPHRDPWNTTRDTQVFSAIRAAVWHGKTVGYLEVTAHASDLERIFSVSSMDGLTVQAIFDDDDILYKAQKDSEGTTSLQTPSGDASMAVMLHSKPLGLNVYITQSAAVHDQSVRALITRYVSISAFILAATVLLIILFSLQLTNSIRKLTKKVRSISVSEMLHLEAPAAPATVTSPRDAEIHDLECVFNDLTERLRVSMNNELTMWRANLHAQLDALQAQINPHFIYNTLNIISAKGMECGNEEITDICDQFAQMLRYSTNLNNSAVTLGDELNHVRSYLHLVKARYEDRLSYAINVPSNAELLLIPKLILQPLVENTIQHGYTDSDQVIRINIQGDYVPNGLRLTIRDNGQGFSAQALDKINAAFAQINNKTTYEKEDASEHIGLANTYMRLTYYSGGRIPVKLYNDPGAVIELTIPTGAEGKK